MKIETVMEALEKNGYSVRYCSSGKEAADYLDSNLDGRVIGFGDSATMSKMKLYEKLSAHNMVKAKTMMRFWKPRKNV